MDWSKSYSSSWRIYRVNRETWADAEQVADVDAVEITRTADGNMMESGSIEVTGDMASDYYRIVMIAEQGGEIERVDVATLLFDVTDGEIDHGTEVRNLDGFSVLYPASKTAVVSGEYAPSGVNGAQYVADLLTGTINAPVEVEGSFTLNSNIVHELGSTVLEAAWDVLDAGGFVIRIDGRGVVHICRKPTNPVLILDNLNTRLLGNGIEYETDLSEIPNRYVVLEDDIKTLAVNSDPASPVSTVSRGYCIDEIDESPTPVDGETYAAYAHRRLKEESVLKDERTYTREYAPGADLYCIVRGSIRGLEGDMRITSQTLKCGAGLAIEEKAVREVGLWEG